MLRAPGKRVTLIVALVLTCVLAAAGCSGADTPEDDGAAGLADVTSAVESLTGSEREARLLELVEAEGSELTLYTSMSPSVVYEVVGAFEDAYDVDVGLYRASSEIVFERLEEEADAGFRGADVVETNGTELTTLDKDGILVPYDPPGRADLIPLEEYESWIPDRFNTFVVARNTDLVGPEEAPGSWEDLADPRWEGKLAIDPSDVDWYRQLWLYWVEQEGVEPEEADRRFEAIAANALVVKGHTARTELLAGGEFPLSVSYLHVTENLLADDAPVAWEPAVEPVFARPNGIALVDGVRHPAAAVLFYDWLLGPGQEVLAERNVDPVRKDLAPTRDVERVLVDVKGLEAEQEEWTDRFDELLTGAGGD